MHRAYSFPVTVERSRTKERLEASLAGLCELELRKQRQECLVLGALALGDPQTRGEQSGGALPSFWGQENWTLRRQLSALQSSPWGLMQTLEQQVGELRVDGEDHDGQGETGDSRPSSGFYESSEGQSPRVYPGDPTEAVSPRMHAKDRPKSLGDPHLLNGDADSSVMRCGLPRSFSAPYPPLEGIAEETTAGDPWQWDNSRGTPPWEEHLNEEQVGEDCYQQALRVESYILSLIQRHTLAPRPCKPRTTISPDPLYCNGSGHSSLNKRNHSLTKDQRMADPHLQPLSDPSSHRSHGWGCESPVGQAAGGEAPSLEEDSYLDLPYPQCRTQSEAGRLPSPLPSQDPNCNLAASNLCCEPLSPHRYLHGPSSGSHKDHLVSAQYIPGQDSGRSPRRHNAERPSPHRSVSPPDPHSAKSRSAKKSYNEKQKSKKSTGKTSRSHSENSVLAQRVLLERRYSTTERHHSRPEECLSHGDEQGAHQGGCNGGGRRWCSNLELSQDEGEPAPEQAQRRPPRKPRQGSSCHYSQPQKQHPQRWHSDHRERAPLCQGEEGYSAAAPAESESSMSEVYSPASSSLSSDSDESGGLVWPHQLPPRLATASSPSPQAAANPPAQPKAFVKIKASHALKKKILRFRSGSLKVMTTV
ncbi:dapper homolog 3 [Neosynchiropus ocellatus]